MRAIVYFLALTSAMAMCHRAAAQQNANKKTLQKIFADWKQRQGILKTARYVVTGNIEYYDKEVPPGEPVRPQRNVVLLDLEHWRYRVETTKSIMNDIRGKGLFWTPWVKTWSFDGKRNALLTHREANQIQQDGADLAIIKGTGARQEFEAHLLPIFYAHGLVQTIHSDIRMKESPTYNEEDFDVRGQQLLQEHDCMIVRTEPRAKLFDELWVDLAEQSAVRRYVEFSGSQTPVRLDVKWKRHVFGAWPQSWRLTWTMDGRVWRVENLEVQTFEANAPVDDASFTLEAKPGMKVDVIENPPPGKGLNPNFQAVRHYLVSPSGSWKELSAKGFTTLDGKELPPEPSLFWVYWLIAGVLALLGVLAYYLVRRKRKVCV